MTSMRSPLSPPNHQSSSPASQTERTARASLPSASVVVATTVTSPETPGAIAQSARPSLSVEVLQCAASFVVRIWLRSEEHTSELQSLMRISYAVLCLKNKINDKKK